MVLSFIFALTLLIELICFHQSNAVMHLTICVQFLLGGDEFEACLVLRIQFNYFIRGFETPIRTFLVSLFTPSSLN